MVPGAHFQNNYRGAYYTMYASLKNSDLIVVSHNV